MPLPTNDPHARIVYKPLASKASGNTEQQKGAGGLANKANTAQSPYLRAANEDDDGYDPYSDRRDEPPLFEENPWD